MQDLEADKLVGLDTLIKNANSDIEAKIIECSPSETVIAPPKLWPLPTPEELQQQRNEFIQQFMNFHLNFKDKVISNTISNQIYLPNRSQILQKFTNNSQFIIRNLLNNANRRTKELNYVKENLNEYARFQKSIASIEFSWKTIEQALSNGNSLSHEQLKFVDTMKLIYSNIIFPINSINGIIKLFPVLYRHNILKIASNNILSKYNFENFVAQKPETHDYFYSELERLANVLKIEFDIEKEDGQHFYYSCDKIFADSIREPFPAISVEPPSMTDNATMAEIVGEMIADSVPIAEGVQEIFEQLMSSDIDSLNASFSEGAYGIARRASTLPEIVIALNKLKFVRGRKLLEEIVFYLKKLDTISKKMKAECGGPASMFSRMKKQIYSVLTTSVNNGGNDIKRQIEFALELELQLQKAKYNLLKFYAIIADNFESQLLVKDCGRIVEKRPALLNPNGSAEAFRLEIAIMERKANIISFLLEMCKIHEKQCEALSGKLYFSDQLTTIFGLQLFPEMMQSVNEAADEITSSMLINNIKFGAYILDATWTFLDSLLKDFRNDPLNPFSICQGNLYNSLDDSTVAFHTLPLFDLSFVPDGSETHDRIIDSAFDLKLQIYKTKHLLPAYKSQCEDKDIHSPFHYTLLLDRIITFDNISYDENFANSLDRALILQRRLNALLETALLYNNFAYDYKFAKEFFHLPNSFVLHPTTKSDPIEIQVFSQMYISIPEKTEAFLDLSGIDFEVEEQVKVICHDYSTRSEIAQIINLTKQFLSNFSNADNCASEVGFFQDGLIDPFKSPFIDECLNFEQNLDEISTILSMRLRLLYFARLENTMSVRASKVFELMYNQALIDSSPYFQNLRVELRRRNDFSPQAVLEFFKECEDIYSLRIVSAVMLAGLQLAENSSFKGRRFKPREEFRQFKSVYKSFFITPNRYVPKFMEKMFSPCGESARALLSDAIKNVDDLISDSLIVAKLKNEYQSPVPFIQSFVTVTLLKLAFYQIITRDQSEVNVISAFGDFDQVVFQNGYSELEAMIAADIETPRVFDSSKTKENNALIAQYSKYIDTKLIEKQKQKVMKYSEALMKEYQISLATPNPMTKPDIYSKKNAVGKKQDFIFPAPQDLDSLFNTELKYAEAKIVYSAFTALNNSKSEDESYDLQKLEDQLKSISPEIINIFQESQPILEKTWLSLLASGLQQNEISLDDYELLRWFEHIYSVYFDGSISRNLEKREPTNIFKLNSLRKDFNLIKKEQKEFEENAEIELSKYFNDVLSDLKRQILIVKGDFSKAHESWFGGALKMLSDLFADEETTKKTIENHEFKKEIDDPIERTKQEIEDLKKDILRMRAYRAINTVGVTRQYQKLIAAVGADRKHISALLWTNRREFEESMRKLEDDLKDAYSSLTSREIEVEDLRNEMVKSNYQTNIEKHLKQMVQTRELDLQVNVEKLSDAGDVNISELLEQLDDATDELESLKDETESLEDAMYYEIHMPTQRAKNIRRKIQSAKIANASARSSARGIERRDLPPNQEPNLFEINQKLKEENESLKRKIAMLEESTQKSTPTSARGPRQQLSLKRIVKPSTAINSSRTRKAPLYDLLRNDL